MSFKKAAEMNPHKQTDEEFNECWGNKLSKRYLRICFEPKPNLNINDVETFKHMAESYLASFDISYAGIISMDLMDKVGSYFEPTWQYIIWNSTTACRDYLIEYNKRNPMNGYYLHVYEKHPGENEVKV